MRSWRRCTLALLAAVALAMASSTPAFAAVTPPWSSASTDDTNSDFDTGTLSFPGVIGRSLTIQNAGSGYYHDHENGCRPTIEVHLNGSWLLVRSGPISNDVEELLGSIPTVPFPTGVVDGIRLGSTCPVDNAYHEVNSAMTFLIAEGGSAIPTLSETALLALAALMLAAGGFALRR